MPLARAFLMMGWDRVVGALKPYFTASPQCGHSQTASLGAIDMIRTAKIFAGAALALGLLAANALAAGSFHVTLDQAKPLALKEPATGVVIGNPAIAGVTLQSDKLLFITGRAYGSTNLIIVGANGRPVYETRITVGADEGGSTVLVTRGTSTISHECAPLCRKTPDMADDQRAFDEYNSAIGSHSTTARGATERWWKPQRTDSGRAWSRAAKAASPASATHWVRP